VIYQRIRNLRPPARLIALAALSTLTMWLGQGCTRTINDRTTVGGDSILTLTPTAARTTPSMQPSTGPSLIDGQRTHWEPQTIVVEMDGVEHQPHYTTSQPNYSRSMRAVGDYPTASSALTLGSELGPQVSEALAAPFHAATDVVLFIPRAFGQPPCMITLSPVDRMQRYQNGSEIKSPTLETEVVPIQPVAE